MIDEQMFLPTSDMRIMLARLSQKLNEEPMPVGNMLGAKSNLSKLVDAVESGAVEEITGR